MRARPTPPAAVYGISARAPRPTRAAIRLAVLRMGLPLLAVLTALDAVIWWVTTTLGWGCMALWCWI